MAVYITEGFLDKFKKKEEKKSNTKSNKIPKNLFDTIAKEAFDEVLKVKPKIDSLAQKINDKYKKQGYENFVTVKLKSAKENAFDFSSYDTMIAIFVAYANQNDFVKGRKLDTADFNAFSDANDEFVKGLKSILPKPFKLHYGGEEDEFLYTFYKSVDISKYN